MIWEFQSIHFWMGKPRKLRGHHAGTATIAEKNSSTLVQEVLLHDGVDHPKAQVSICKLGDKRSEHDITWGNFVPNTQAGDL